VSKNNQINETDARILEILQADGRRSYADLGADLGMAGPSAHERVKKLEARGVIRGYTAQVDPRTVGLGVVAFMWVTQAPGSVAADLTPAFAAVAEIEECHHITGEADYLLKVRARDMDHLGRVVRRVQTTPHVFSTETDVVFTTGFERRPLPLGRGDARDETVDAGTP
jgi:Lrp/AsnC family transcriptional regulator, leucine-responsive regulatory protein